MSEDELGPTEIGLSYSNVTDLSHCVSVNTQTIIATHSMIESLNGLEKCRRLHRVSLAFNRIACFRQRDANIRVDILDLSGNPLIHLENHPMCRELNVSATRLTNLVGCREGVEVIRIGHSTILESLDGIPKSVKTVECSCSPFLVIVPEQLNTCEIIRELPVLARIYAYAQKKLVNRDPSHAFEHHLRVREIATKIHQVDETLQQFQRNIVEIACLVHDIPDYKYREDPGATGYQDVHDFVMNLCGDTMARAVDQIIRNMSWSKRANNNIEEHWKYLRDIVSDADKIDALGPQGLQRAYDYSKRKRFANTHEGLVAEVKKHCNDKLNHLYSSIVTTEGRRIAKDKQVFIQQWYEGKVEFEFSQ